VEIIQKTKLVSLACDPWPSFLPDLFLGVAVAYLFFLTPAFARWGLFPFLETNFVDACRLQQMFFFLRFYCGPSHPPPFVPDYVLHSLLPLPLSTTTQFLEIPSIGDDNNSRHARDSYVWYLYCTIRYLCCTVPVMLLRFAADFSLELSCRVQKKCVR